MQHCPNCGAGELKFIAAILERPVIEKMLTHLGAESAAGPSSRVAIGIRANPGGRSHQLATSEPCER